VGVLLLVRVELLFLSLCLLQRSVLLCPMSKEPWQWLVWLLESLDLSAASVLAVVLCQQAWWVEGAVAVVFLQRLQRLSLLLLQLLL
jgi:hypothetical protein